MGGSERVVGVAEGNGARIPLVLIVGEPVVEQVVEGLVRAIGEVEQQRPAITI